ncbi:MAG: FeoA family protein [Crocinitomicaceae bacterium]|jgi:ferrous iron transport protein A|nr:FeoA family protein [Crocinitomicaceae bacterium]MDG1735090.1 FeoA family protein [Crocinitomicaceae bacterium]MDG2506448.1 FeoA family protein [Crocinitomicaceae bacterium]
MQNSLADCKVGEEVEVLSIEDDFIATKLIEMGMTENLKTRVVLIAPLGDPIAIDIKGFILSLRKSEAKKIRVKKIGQN